jgi:hypothetical protein
MSEETTSQDQNDGTWSGLKKTLIGTLTTLIAGGGTWLGVMLFQGGHADEKEETKTEQVAPAQTPVINLNVDNSSQNNSSNGGSTIIRERVVEKPAKPEEKKPEKKSESEDAPW